MGATQAGGLAGGSAGWQVVRRKAQNEFSKDTSKFARPGSGGKHESALIEQYFGYTEYTYITELPLSCLVYFLSPC